MWKMTNRQGSTISTDVVKHFLNLAPQEKEKIISFLAQDGYKTT
jgi:hypothetical protein